MNKLLKQLVRVLDENNIQVNKLNVEDNIPGEISIEVNKKIAIVDRGGSYALYTEDANLDKTYYISLTKALEVLANYLGKVKEGDILAYKDKCTYTVVKHVICNNYNLIDNETNRLLYVGHVSLEFIQEQINDGVLHVE